MPTINVQVKQGTDDNLYRKSIGGYWLTNGPAVGYRSPTSNMYGGAWRFNNVNIPQGAIINSAFVNVNSLTDSIGEVVRSRLRGEANDNPPTFQDYTTETPRPYLDFKSRPRTATFIDWDNIPPWMAGVWYRSPDIAAIIQEIVNRPGWVPGNSIIIFWDDFDNRSDPRYGAIREGQSFDNDPSEAAQLEITYSDITPHLLSVTTTPIDGVLLTIDGVPVGNTPLTVNVEDGSHTISVPSEVTT